MTTQKQIEANQQNALKSTGPRTSEGKRIVGKNAVIYGLFSKDVVLEGGLVNENQEEFESLLLGLIADLKPVGSMETILVEKIAAGCWRLKRLFRAECGSARKKILNAEEYNAFNPKMPVCPIDIHELLNRRDLSIETLSGDIVEQSGKLQLSANELIRDKDFLRFLEERYPDATPDDLSVHQLKRLQSAYRADVRERIQENSELLHYLQAVRPQHFGCLVPDDQIVRYAAYLERSLLRDLAVLKQLQAASSER